MGSRAKISPPSPGGSVHTFILHGIGMFCFAMHFSPVLPAFSMLEQHIYPWIAQLITITGL